MVKNGLQNGTERKSSKPQIPWISDFPFENEAFLTFEDSTNEFRDPEYTGKDILLFEIRVSISPIDSFQ